MPERQAVTEERKTEWGEKRTRRQGEQPHRDQVLTNETEATSPTRGATTPAVVRHSRFRRRDIL